MNQEPDQTELLRELIENVDQFREVATETMRVLHRKQRIIEQRLFLHRIALGFLAFLFVLMTILSFATPR